ncbi:two-component system LytT family sensor kinase [Pedobacter africanus]|uniref:Sensor histidine kinase YesM n=1 Tax=Pedobacter africanus TaxID=151894 RepID=A0ACC6KY78_9SPHI|nr:histidine kinase [Pedobacter africanus]MDR6784219.1 sensor histidine kinase YesM [Pedobacter africanus]
MIKLKETTKIELWIVTSLIAISCLFSLLQNLATLGGLGTNFNISAIFNDTVWTYVLFSHLITTVFYLLLTLYVQKEFEKPDEKISTSVFFIYLLIHICFLAGFISKYFIVLLSIKMMVIYFTRNKQNTLNKVYYEATLLVAWSMFLHACALILNAHQFIVATFTFVAPLAIFSYIYLIYIQLPLIIKRKRPKLTYIGVIFLLAPLSNLLIVLTSLLFFSNRDNHDNILGFSTAINSIAQFIVVPLFAWNIYKARNSKKDQEIYTLKTELGKSDANLNFLKSQINPHFLFNALNTLYGTALQEKAERTGEGIQKLGDMMRFMLQENVEDKILLSKDVDYLNNYIALQKLRTSTSPDIVIQTQIEEQPDDLAIAPMLLIPFVENAFKHGISLKYPSHIKITLQTKNNTLYFDVHNSIHPKNENDPEKQHGGIGLQNVKQRLALLYPGHHELLIRESAREFFIHLTLQLREND